MIPSSYMMATPNVIDKSSIITPMVEITHVDKENHLILSDPQ
jgi:hypothetical protein